jgi:hypothetical protein
MSRQLIKRSISLIVVLAILVSSCVLWFSMVSKAWFKDDRTSYFNASHIYSITQGEANNIASFKNGGEFNADLQFEVINGEFTERFIPGDLLYYTFIVTGVDVTAAQTYMLEMMGMDAAAIGSGSDAIAFAGNCRIESNTLIIAVLEKLGDESSGYYYELYPYDINGNSFYDVSNGLYNAGVDSIYTVADGLAAEFTFTIPSGMSYPPATGGTCDLLVIVPIWYMDTGADQNTEMDCSLTIAGCTIYPYTGGGQ